MKPFNWTDKAAIKIAGAFLTLQAKFTSAVNKRFALVPVPKMKIAVITFSLISGGFSLCLAINAVLTQPKTAIQIDPANIPMHVDRTGEQPNELMVEEETYQQIQAFKKSVSYDSIIQSRPGLLDSIVRLEEVYQSQKLK